MGRDYDPPLLHFFEGPVNRNKPQLLLPTSEWIVGMDDFIMVHDGNVGTENDLNGENSCVLFTVDRPCYVQSGLWWDSLDFVNLPVTGVSFCLTLSTVNRDARV